MAYNIGLNVIEVDGKGSPAIQGAATSVAGFNILTQRGIPNRPARVTTYNQFADQFGSYFANGLGAYLVKGFFDNGGVTAYINRVVANDAATGATPARTAVQDVTPTDIIRLEAGYRGMADPGTWANNLFIRVAISATPVARIRETAPATVDTAGLPATSNMAGAAPLSVTVDGESTATTIPFQVSDFASPPAATPTEIRDAINRRTTKVIASVVGGQIRLTSAGQFTSLQVAPHPILTFPATLVRGTRAALSATGTVISNTDVLKVGDSAVIVAGANRAIAKITRVSPLTGEVEWTSTVANINTFDPLTFTIQRLEFDLSVANGAASEQNLVERFNGLSFERDSGGYVLSQLNDPVTGSKYLRTVDLRGAADTASREPRALDWARMTPGRDGTPTAFDFIGNSGQHTGFSAFDPANIQLLCCERTDPAIVDSALTYCSNRGDCMFVGSTPEGSVGAGTAIAYGQRFQKAKVYGALYGPYIKVIDPLAQSFKFIPPTGHVMGVFSRIETGRGIFKAPAGDEAYINGALDVEYQLSDADHTDLVKSGSINGIRAVPGAGIVVDSSRTLSTDTRWLYVNVRLLFNYVKSSLKQGLRWVRQEPNRDTLWSVVRNNSVIPFLNGLYRQGAFGAGKPDEVFTVICDASNNPPDQVDQGIFKIEIYFYPSRPAETIVILVGQQPSGAKVAES